MAYFIKVITLDLEVSTEFYSLLQEKKESEETLEKLREDMENIRSKMKSKYGKLSNNSSDHSEEYNTFLEELDEASKVYRECLVIYKKLLKKIYNKYGVAINTDSIATIISHPVKYGFENNSTCNGFIIEFKTGCIEGRDFMTCIGDFSEIYNQLPNEDEDLL